MSRFDVIMSGQDGVFDVKGAAAAHTAGEGDYAGIKRFVGVYAYTDLTFDEATTRERGGAVVAGETYPAGSFVPGPFSVVKFGDADSFGCLIGEG